MFFVAALVMGCNSGEKASDNNIDRKALLGRHNPHVEAIDSLAPMTVGNGGFAFTVDIRLFRKDTRVDYALQLSPTGDGMLSLIT